MFGLMRARKCGMTADEKSFRRLNYCGTCKTIGSLYSQKARLLLNHDTVFLAELLTALSGDSVKDWQKSYQSYNCLSLPKTEMPLSLQFAATANVVLTEFKIADHVTDEKKNRYKFAYRIFSKEFFEAEKLLKDWKFPLETVREILQTQEKREADSTDLDELAEPTAQTTALFFSEGAKLIKREELSNTVAEIGYKFGKLIYLIDAFEDYDKDFKSNNFNAIRASYKLKDSELPADVERKIASAVIRLENEIVARIYALPLEESEKKIFSLRLRENLQRKIQLALPLAPIKKVCLPKKKHGFKQRWENASEKARNLAQTYSWQMPLVFIFIFIFALAAPAQSREAKSARECFDLSFNLMFLGSVFGSIVAFPKTILMQENLAQKAERKRREGWCDSCDCCDGCDCCCCACDGCDSCDGCGCCDGCDCCDCSCD